MVKSLYHYQKILDGAEQAKYSLTKKTPIYFQPKEELKALWNRHEKKAIDKSAETSLLDLKIELAERIFSACKFCERKCNVDRHKAIGECGVQEARIASQFMHWGEEPILIPSYTIFFSGCTFHCVFCQNWSISQARTGYWLEPELLAQMIAKRALEGAKNVNWVGGEPTPNLPYILKVLKHTQTSLPQVWNSNMYCSMDTMKLLAEVIDVYLTDFKYGDDRCAFRLSKVRNYWEIITRNHLLASEQGELLIRHLVMPNHLECCTKPVLDWIAENLPNSLVNLMFQYRPEYHAKDYKEIAQPISGKEYTKARNYAESLHLNLI